MATTAFCAFALAGCAVGGNTGSAGPVDASPHSASVENAEHTVPPARVQMAPKPGKSVPWDSHPTLTARHGTIASVRLSSADQHRITGTLLDAHTWRVDSRLVPDTKYTATVQLRSSDGHRVTRQVRFHTAPAAEQLSMSATPGPGWTRGVGETIKVHFNRPVTQRADVEHHMYITTSRGRIEGAWHWFSDTEAHFRPRHFWPGNTKVTVHVDLEDLYVGEGVWGDRNHDWSWQVGDSHISHVNADTHRFKVTVNGKQIADWPTGMGQPAFQTRSGIYSVLMKTELTQMDSCSVGLGCDESSPNYYNLPVHWDVRLTNSGTFVHAAPWDSQLGSANTSHGCIHLSTDHAKTFYDMSIPGDVVIVKGTTRPASTTDPGMADWTIPWSEWAN